MQLVDELSMIYTTCLMCYSTFSYSRSRLYSFSLALGLISLAIFITLYYHYLQDPAFHQNAYAILTAIGLFRSLYVMEFTLRPSLTKKEKEFKLDRKRSMNANEKEMSQSGDRRDAKILNTMWKMIGTGLSIFLGGFALWNLDIKYCQTLRSWRTQVGLPWGILLEGHGWWYVEEPNANGDEANVAQASHDWSGRLLLHHLGYLASALLEWASGRVRVILAFNLLAARNGSNTKSKFLERYQRLQEAAMMGEV